MRIGEKGAAGSADLPVPHAEKIRPRRTLPKVGVKRQGLSGCILQNLLTNLLGGILENASMAQGFELDFFETPGGRWDPSTGSIVIIRRAVILMQPGRRTSTARRRFKELGWKDRKIDEDSPCQTNGGLQRELSPRSGTLASQRRKHEKVQLFNPLEYFVEETRKRARQEHAVFGRHVNRLPVRIDRSVASHQLNSRFKLASLTPARCPLPTQAILNLFYELDATGYSVSGHSVDRILGTLLLRTPGTNAVVFAREALGRAASELVHCRLPDARAQIPSAPAAGSRGLRRSLCADASETTYSSPPGIHGREFLFSRFPFLATKTRSVRVVPYTVSSLFGGRDAGGWACAPRDYNGPRPRHIPRAGVALELKVVDELTTSWMAGAAICHMVPHGVYDAQPACHTDISLVRHAARYTVASANLHTAKLTRNRERGGTSVKAHYSASGSYQTGSWVRGGHTVPLQWMQSFPRMPPAYCRVLASSRQAGGWVSFSCVPAAGYSF
ncbi:hypothetical protein C8F04DRAFT_1199157 [Mycena alexandri]|uniref:Uncharacterized protein n=1 Tax=Mycena alexandri TaxID=1745969 RepID=A0AAD6WMM3_9AGAR|nr:hypothetical protein C8F04DRAFT_1199157 [Mycena alexandri]